MRRKLTISLKELFDLLVDAAVGDAMADRGLEHQPAVVRDRSDHDRPSSSAHQSNVGPRAGFRKWLFSGKIPISRNW